MSLSDRCYNPDCNHQRASHESGKDYARCTEIGCTCAAFWNRDNAMAPDPDDPSATRVTSRLAAELRIEGGLDQMGHSK